MTEKPPKLSPSETNTTSTTTTPPSWTGHYGPLAHVNTAESRVPAFGGEFQPGLFKSPKKRKFANPAPLGLCGFALTTFVLGCVQMNVQGLTKPNMLVGPALAYGGLVQLLAGMWYVFLSFVFGLLDLGLGIDTKVWCVGKWQLETPSAQQSYLPTADSGSRWLSHSSPAGSRSNRHSLLRIRGPRLCFIILLLCTLW